VGWFDLRFIPVPEGVCILSLDVTEQKQAERLLRASEERFRLLVDGVREYAIFLLDPDGNVLTWNAAAERMLGHTSAAIVGRSFAAFYPPEEAASRPRTALERAAATGRHREEGWLQRSDGSRFLAEVVMTPVYEGGRLQGFASVTRDLTELRRLEQQLRQAQKMEAVGQLAGGVAHDFNNLLTIILGNSELVLAAIPDGDASSLVGEIRDAGERARALTRQLLAFGRQQVVEPKVLDLNAVVRETDRMLQRLIGEDIRLTTVLDPALRRVKVDPGQIEQVMMNLSVNARDAMPQGGGLTIETRNVDLDGGYLRTHAEARGGGHVLLSVTDTGVGMNEATRVRIFEPFFTTKGPGSGTGLGLAVVYGIVKQSGGHIEVYSEPGVGTSFKVYLPTVEEAIRTTPARGVSRPDTGGETVLLVEDDDAVRSLAARSLRARGYAVLAARDASEALDLFGAHARDIALLLTDLVMPGMSGRQLAEQVQGEQPSIKVLFMSGYTDDAVVRHGLLQSEVAFLQKPFTPSLLTRRVRDLLDGI
jgi:PAS domain S-box-containing protein